MIGTAERSSLGCLFGRDAPWFYAFDLLALNGRDLRYLPLLDRQARLAGVVPEGGCRVLFLDGIVDRGCDFFREICRRYLEGMVAERAHGTYQTDQGRTFWCHVCTTVRTAVREAHQRELQSRVRRADVRGMFATDGGTAVVAVAEDTLLAGVHPRAVPAAAPHRSTVRRAARLI